MTWLPSLVVGALLAALGVRLAHSGRATGGPESWLGMFFIGTGFAMPLQSGFAMGMDFGVDAGSLNAASQAWSFAALAGLAVFVQRVFRPDASWARRACRVLGALLVAQFALLIATGAHRLQSSPVHSVTSLLMTSVFGWAFSESFSYWLRLRRRRAIGAADPVIANRFGLWSVWTGVLMLYGGFVSALRLYAMTVPGSGSGTLAVREDFAWALDALRVLLIATGPVMVAALWLSFFPPQRYLAGLRERARPDQRLRSP